ncbi:C40 family peptidase [Sporosarcina aquimarina]|uniref:C40 family peptidase n=1 Tax=Sporosarcina aquimarina TaxID=114975 RepID=UPI00203D33DD|nr:C40 family peptidase [Sporosarcina aquimarina]
MKKQLVVFLAFMLVFASVFTANPQKSQAASGDSIVAYAKKFEGTPYLFGGSTPAAFDCSGYILYVFKFFGISLPRTSETQFNVGTSVARDNLQAGDLIFFENTYKPGISHTGIYIGNGNFISAESSGVKISNLDTNPYWGPKYAGAKRVVGITTTPPTKPVAPTPTPPTSFSDVAAKHPAYEAIETLSTQKIISGFPDGSFQPETQVTRGQAATMINRVLKLRPRFPLTYSDVPATHAFAKDISAMSDAGILSGYEDGSFGMYDPLTKAQLAIILDRAFSMTTTASVLTKPPYLDVPVTYRAAEAIGALKKMDKTTVFQTSKFSIAANATRAQFSAALYSVAELR